MARKKNKSFGFIFICCFLIGVIVGFGGLSYFKLPETESIIVSGDLFYSKNDETIVDTIAVEDANISVHFLELGNKYTGDCTYIKTDTCDILIDCGSKSNSVGYVANYLNQYVTDGTLEYVIVTHAHQDHYAGFATTENVDSIFDLYECENIIDFAKTKQTTGKVFLNYQRELADEVNAGAKHFTALDCINGTNGAQKTFDIGTNITLTILDSYYYYNEATTENDYSVCSLVTYEYGEGQTRNMLFTGDLEAEGEEYLVSMNTLPQVDLYKAGHHGSKTSSSETLLSVIQPKTVCVCCCAGSSEYTSTKDNQFPTQQFINNVAKYTKDIFVTTLCIDYKNDKFEPFNGNIVFMCSVTGYNVKCSNNNTILKESDWFKQNRTWPEGGK